MAAPRKYPDELPERAVRLAVDARRDPATRTGAWRRIGEQLGINPEKLRNWVTQAEADAVRDALVAEVTSLPDALRRSLTWDQGAEMAEHRSSPRPPA